MIPFFMSFSKGQNDKFTGKPQFGDYQANGIMAAAKKLGLNPREFAQKVLDNAQLI